MIDERKQQWLLPFFFETTNARVVLSPFFLQNICILPLICIIFVVGKVNTRHELANDDASTFQHIHQPINAL